MRTLSTRIHKKEPTEREDVVIVQSTSEAPTASTKLPEKKSSSQLLREKKNSSASSAFGGVLTMKPSQVQVTLRATAYLTGSTATTTIIHTSLVTPIGSDDWPSIQDVFSEVRLDNFEVLCDTDRLRSDSACSTTVVAYDPTGLIQPDTYARALSMANARWIMPTTATRAFEQKWKCGMPSIAIDDPYMLTGAFQPVIAVNNSEVNWGRISFVCPRYNNSAFSCDLVFTYRCTFRLRR